MRRSPPSGAGLRFEIWLANLSILAGFLLGFLGGGTQQTVSSFARAEAAPILALPVPHIRRDFYSTDALVDEAMREVGRFYEDAAWPCAPTEDIHALRSQRKRLAAAIVQVMASNPEEEMTLGTGIVVGRGRWVLTAQHVAQDHEQFQIRTRNGEMLKALWITGRRTFAGDGQDLEEDWAILGLVQPLPSVPEIRFGTIARGQLAVSFGYGKGLGVTDRGEVRWMGAASPAQPLESVETIYRCLGMDGSLVLRPLAGLVDGLGGSSGGPVVNVHGEIVGLNRRLSLDRSDSGMLESEASASPITNAVETLEKIETLWGRLGSDFRERPRDRLEAVRRTLRNGPSK